MCLETFLPCQLVQEYIWFLCFLKLLTSPAKIPAGASHGSVVSNPLPRWCNTKPGGSLGPPTPPSDFTVRRRRVHQLHYCAAFRLVASCRNNVRQADEQCSPGQQYVNTLLSIISPSSRPAPPGSTPPPHLSTPLRPAPPRPLPPGYRFMSIPAICSST